MNKISSAQSVVLVPSYQPGEALLDTVNKLLAANFAVVIVDDGSEEKYQTVFDQLSKKVHLLRHDVNRGKGAGLKTGLRYIQDNFHNSTVITADADGQHSVDDIEKMARSYRLHSGSLLLGARTFENGNIPFKSKFGNLITRKVFSLVTKQRLRDTQTGLRAFSQSLIDFMLRVPGERFEYETNVLLACSSEDIEIVEQPIQTIYENNNAGSHFDPVRDSWAIYKEIIKFASSSLLAFGIDYVLFIVMLRLTSSLELAMSVTLANIVARITSASVNFTMNKRLVFKHKGSVTKGALQYFTLAGGILIGNTVLLNVLTDSLSIAPYIAKILTEITFFSISYIVQRKVIFAQKTASEL